MLHIIREFVDGKQKTNLHAILCLKKIYHDDQRPIDQSFDQREISSMWQEVALINPTFLNSGVAPVYMTKQKFITKSGLNLSIVQEYRESFGLINWEDLMQSVQSIQPLFSPIFQKLNNDREEFLDYAIGILNEPPPGLELRLIPALLEIFSYAVLKTHLKYFGADIFRWTRTNSNDGGVDMTCGDVSYSITTNLDNKKMEGDASKQVRDRLNFITIRNKVSSEKVQEIEQDRGLSINIIELTGLVQIINGFNRDQKNQLLEILNLEIAKEI
jgi:hypothetical protein